MKQVKNYSKTEVNSFNRLLMAMPIVHDSPGRWKAFMINCDYDASKQPEAITESFKIQSILVA